MSAGTNVLGIGTATPAGTYDQVESAAFAAVRCCSTDHQRAWLDRIYLASGVQRRASVLLESADETKSIDAFYPPPAAPTDRGPTTAARLIRYAEEAAALGVTACARAFADAAVDPRQITHLVTVSCTGLVSPGIDAQLIERLGLARDVGRVNLGFMGCHGALNGLRAAAAFAQSTPESCVLVCCIELCSLHFHYGWNMEQVIANALFADGAAAVIVSASERGDVQLVETASLLTRDSQAAMSWRIGDHGFEMGLRPEIPNLIRASLRGWLEPWLASHCLRIEDVAQWAIHPGGPHIIQATIEALDLPEAAGATSREVLAAHGNMSSPTLLFILQRFRERSIAGPTVALGFGPGLVFEAALFSGTTSPWLSACG